MTLWGYQFMQNQLIVNKGVKRWMAQNVNGQVQVLNNNLIKINKPLPTPLFQFKALVVIVIMQEISTTIQPEKPLVSKHENLSIAGFRPALKFINTNKRIKPQTVKQFPSRKKNH